MSRLSEQPASDSKSRFTGRASVYARYRPTYPHAILEVLRRNGFLSGTGAIADVGSGTGLLARLFLDDGHTVFAVEPNDDMRLTAETQLSGYKGFRSVRGSAEETTLATGSVDLVTAGQAFHWFSPALAKKEFARISRHRRVALIYNTREHASSGLAADYDAVIRRHGRNFSQVRGPEEDTMRTFFEEHRLFTIPNPKSLDLEGLTGRLSSASYMPAPGEDGYRAMIEDIQRMFERHQRNGRVTMQLTTEIFLGTV